MRDEIDKELLDTGGDLPIETKAIALPAWFPGIRMIDRIEAIRLIGFYNGSISIFDAPHRAKLDVPNEIVDFEAQVDWLVGQSANAKKKAVHWNTPERIEGGVRVAVHDFTYIEITDASVGEDLQFEVYVYSTRGGANRVEQVARLVGAVIGPENWIDNPDLDEMVHHYRA